MRKNILILFCFFSSQLIASYDETTCCYSFSRERHPNFLYLGIGASGCNLNVEIQDYHTSLQSCFGNFILGYEYLQPENIYIKIEAFSALFGSTPKINQSIYPRKNYLRFFNGDLRLGYTLPKANLFISPFLSLGFYGLIPSYFYQSDGGLRQTSFYFGGGMQILYPVFYSFDVAIDVEFFGDLISKISGERFGIRYSSPRSNGGAKAALPLIWHLGEDRCFDLRLQPYLFTLSWSDLELFYGASCIAGYHF